MTLKYWRERALEAEAALPTGEWAELMQDLESSGFTPLEIRRAVEAMRARAIQKARRTA